MAVDMSSSDASVVNMAVVILDWQMDFILICMVC